MAAFRSSCALGRATGAHRHDQQLVDAGGPVHRIGRRGGHLERQEGGVVVGCHAAVDKDEGIGIGRALGKGHHLGREEGRCRRAGAHQLPQRQTQVVVLARDLVVFGEGVVTDGPGGVGAGIAHHHHQQGTQTRAAQRGVVAQRLAEFALQHHGERLVIVLVVQALEDEGFVEHLLAAAFIELADTCHRHARRNAGRDDGAGAGAANEVEVVGQYEVGPAAKPGAQVIFELGQDFHAHQAEDAAAVAGEDLLGAGSLHALDQGFVHYRVSVR